MRYIVLLSLILSLPSLAQEAPACDVTVSKNIEHQLGIKSAKIVGGITGNPCYEAQLKIEIFSGDILLYQYQEKFKPHIAVHWESVEERDANNLLEREIEDYNFINCSDLPEIEQTGDLPYYNDLLIPKEQYNELQKSSCKAYVHTYKHYEGNRIVVFPANSKKSIVVR